MKPLRLLALPLLLALAASCLPTDSCACSTVRVETVQGRVVEAGAGAGVSGASLELWDASGALLETTVSGETGGFFFETRTPREVPFSVRITPPDGWALAEGETNPRPAMVVGDRPAEVLFVVERR